MRFVVKNKLFSFAKRSCALNQFGSKSDMTHLILNTSQVQFYTRHFRKICLRLACADCCQSFRKYVHLALNVEHKKVLHRGLSVLFKRSISFGYDVIKRCDVIHRNFRRSQISSDEQYCYHNRCLVTKPQKYAPWEMNSNSVGSD